MRIKLLVLIALGALGTAVVPANADIRGPLSPSGGQSEARGTDNEMAAESQNLVIPGDYYGNSDWVSVYDDIRGPLTPAGSDR
jgi:hypothetical protein